MMVTRDLSIRARQVLGNLYTPITDCARNLGGAGVIAGGLVRDVYYAKMPKDLDIITMDNIGADASIKIVNKAFGKNLKFEEYEPEEKHAYAEDNNVINVYKATDSYFPIDIIVRNDIEGAFNPLSVVSTFDMNINQCAIGRSFHNSYINISKDVMGIDEITDERLVKMRAKYPNHNWAFYEVRFKRIDKANNRNRAKAVHDEIEQRLRLFGQEAGAIEKAWEDLRGRGEVNAIGRFDRVLRDPRGHVPGAWMQQAAWIDEAGVLKEGN